MKILFLITALFICSCKKEWLPRQSPIYYTPPLLNDLIVSRAHYFTYRRWGDAGAVSPHDDSLVFDVLIEGAAKDSVKYQKKEADKIAKNANDTIFDGQKRPEIIYRVHMKFNYFFYDTVTQTSMLVQYDYSLKDTLFHNDY